MGSVSNWRGGGICPYIYAGNNPVSNNDPTGLYDNNTSYASGYSRYRAMKSNFGGNSEEDYYEMAGWSPGDNAFNTVGGGGGGLGFGNHWTNRYRSFEGNVALMSSRQAYEYYGNNMTEGAKFEMANNVRGVERKSVNSFFAEMAKRRGERLFEYFDGRHFQIVDGRVVIPGTNTLLFGFVEPDQNGGCPHCLDPSSIGNNIGGLSYPGGNNPMSMNQKDYNYSYVPTNLAEYPAIGHDRRYDKLGTAGLKGLFTDTRAIGADWKFVKEEFNIAASPFINPVDRASAFGLGFGLGFFASFKTVYKLTQPAGFIEVMMWYNFSNQGVNNIPSVHKH